MSPHICRTAGSTDQVDEKELLEEKDSKHSLVVQWLRLRASARPESDLSQGTRIQHAFEGTAKSKNLKKEKRTEVATAAVKKRALPIRA